MYQLTRYFLPGGGAWAITLKCSRKARRGMIERLREPGRTERLQIRERRTAGHFEMVIAYATWKPHWSAEGFLPFIIGRHDSGLRLLGYVLPFNPVITILTAEDREHAFALAKCWVAWVQSYKTALSKPQ